ncbi:hypothetical protein KA062_01020 [Patescibacteria group bacterium]|nr:hypothetical protein [Patescibacteria group bacterium]
MKFSNFASLIAFFFDIIAKNHYSKGERKMLNTARNCSDEEYAKIDYELEEKERKIKPDSLPGESTMLVYALIFGILLVLVVLLIAIF